MFSYKKCWYSKIPFHTTILFSKLTCISRILVTTTAVNKKIIQPTSVYNGIYFNKEKVKSIHNNTITHKLKSYAPY